MLSAARHGKHASRLHRCEFQEPSAGKRKKAASTLPPSVKEQLCSASESRLPGNQWCLVLKDNYDRKDGYISIVSERLALNEMEPVIASTDESPLRRQQVDLQRNFFLDEPIGPKCRYFPLSLLQNGCIMPRAGSVRMEITRIMETTMT